MEENMIKRKSGWKFLASYPPAKIRLMARRRMAGKTVRAVSLQEIAIASGLRLARVKVISQQLDWVGVDILEAERFCAACNFDPLNPDDRNRQFAYERSCKTRKRRFAFLRKSPWWETEFLPLIESLRHRRAS
jgi:hypothetical protein